MDKAHLKKRFDVVEVEEEFFGPKFVQSAFEFGKWPVIASASANQALSMNWGLIPSWVRDEESALKIRANTVNARIETIAEKPAFRKAARTQHCLIPVEGFFEFREINKQKYPYYVQLKGGEPFALAGIYDEWLNQNSGELIKSFSLLTTEANPLMAMIHNRKKRMPVILRPDQEKAWNRFELDPEQLEAPYPQEKMEAWTVSRLLSSREKERNVSGVLAPFVYPELQLADGLNF